MYQRLIAAAYLLCILNLGVGRERGGSWNNNPRNCRSAYRNNNNPDNRNNNIGFRVSCAAPSTLLSSCSQGGSELADGNLSGVPLKESRPTPVIVGCLANLSKNKKRASDSSRGLSKGNRTFGWLLSQGQIMPRTLRRIPSTGRGYIEPRLEVSQALSLHMVLIPGGSFLMGSPDNEPERTKAEGPQHQVSVSKFLMGRYPVTQAQWRVVATLPTIEHELNPNPSRFEGDDLPVEQVTWYEAVEFCDRLAARTGRPYRLPTEAEWEYACRSGTTSPFHFGDTISTEAANYHGGYTYGDSPKGEYRKSTTPVDQLNNANAFGLSDMHGNVYEWCQDRWHNNYEGAPANGSAWIEDGDTSLRICRGGSWRLNPRSCRSAYRHNSYPDNRFGIIGFRVSCAAPRALA